MTDFEDREPVSGDVGDEVPQVTPPQQVPQVTPQQVPQAQVPQVTPQQVPQVTPQQVPQVQPGRPVPPAGVEQMRTTMPRLRVEAAPSEGAATQPAPAAPAPAQPAPAPVRVPQQPSVAQNQDQPTVARPAAPVRPAPQQTPAPGAPQPQYQGQTQYQAQPQYQGQTQYQAQPRYQAQTQYQAQSRPQHQAPRQQYQAPATITRPAAPQKRWPAFLSGLIGAVLGVLLTLGVGALAIGSGRLQLPGTSNSSAGPVISIDASDEDISISKAVAAKALPSVASIYVVTPVASGVGSGVVVDEEGHILTNYHVIEGAEQITVTLDGQSFDATLVGDDASSDLAVIKADLGDTKATPMEVGDSDALVVGDWVMAIGSPYGLDQSVSTGIVSSLYRSTMLPSTSGTQIYANLIQTDAAINPGNSGGALVNANGELVGINSIIESASGASAGIGFAIAGNYAIDVANTIIAGEDVLHAYIGLSLQTVTAQNARQAGLSVNQGAYVAEVTPGAPGDEAGIKVGDVITRVGRQDIISADALILAVRSHKVGETVDVTLVRGNEEITLPVTLGEDSALQALQQQQQDQNQGFSLEDLFGWSAPDDVG